MIRSILPARPVAFLVGVLLLAACSEASQSPTAPAVFEAKAPVPGGGDEFDVWNPSLWVAGDHPLGRGHLDPDNVSVAGGELRLRLPAGTYDGGEVRSLARYGYGTYETRLRVARAPGSLTAFFLYENRRAAIDEIDIEIPGDGGRNVMFTVWTRSRQTNHRVMQLPFDPTADFHTYKIDYARGRVRFYVDGVLMTEFTKGLPSSSMHVMANAWWPTWLSGSTPTLDQWAAIDWIRY